MANALAAGVDVTGATVHDVVPAEDRGPMLCRAEVAIHPGETAGALHARIKEAEHRLLLEVIANLACRRQPLQQSPHPER